MRFPKYLLLVSSLVLASVAQAAKSNRPNVVFIGIDDMRPELGCDGSSIAVTPNMDALAPDGLLFNRAYVQQPICGPSRASLMTGMWPDSSEVTHNYLEFRDLQPDVVTLPQYFRERGYETAFCGKIFHGKQKDQEHSWSRKPAKVILPRPTGFALPENRAIQQRMREDMFALYGEQAKYGLASGPAYESADVPDETYEDGYQTRIAIATMKEMAKDTEKPFFMALSFKKPHLNWVSPKRYWDLYKPEDIPLATNTQSPTDDSPMGIHPGFELRVRHDIPKDGPIGDDLASVSSLRILQEYI
ncbi:MAG: sulfatase-like hydrolase/transferase [Opitutaceae bacterium]